jgi:hypothetical protein
MTRARATPERARTTASTTTQKSIESTPSPARETRDGAEEEETDRRLDLDDDSSPLLGRLARVTLSDATNAIVDRESGGEGRGKPLGSGFVVKKRCGTVERERERMIDD